MREQTSKAGTSGQKVPKSKFRTKSQQEQTAASKLRIEKWGEKLDAAKEKLAKQKPPKKPGPVKKAGRAMGSGVHGFVHGKLYEVEHENVGTEGAHRSELVGESALRQGKRFVQKKIREHPAMDRKQLELSNLQLQIRPHFLLNTFNLIYTLAQRGQEKDVQQVILYLSDYFRYLFRSGRNLEIFEKEQHLIEAYIGTAKVRYPGAIEADYEYDPEIAFVRVPPLLLHNFVENIVKYAISPGKVTHISIVGQYEDGMVSFMIMDDGGGMTEEQVEELDRSMREPRKDGLHIGYANSLKRLRYSYGEKADIEISSEPGEGVCVTVTFPYDLEEEDEPFDCE